MRIENSEKSKRNKGDIGKKDLVCVTEVPEREERENGTTPTLQMAKNYMERC